MADNVTLPGSGSLISSDEVTRGGTPQHMQIVKLGFGAENNYDGLLTIGQRTMAASMPVVIASDQSVIPVSQSGIWNITGSITVDGTVAATQSGTWNITNISGTVSLPTGAATAALQTQPGVDIGDVTVNNGSGGNAVNIQDGGNSITVDGSITATVSKTALTPSSPTAATVGVASASALVANASRKGLVLTNTSANTISLGLGAAAVLNSGITLTPNGVWVMDEYTFCTSQIFAIASAAGSNLAIQEFA